MTICMRGSVETRSPLPSLVTITDEPVSAISRLAPVMPTSAARNFSRSTLRASATRYCAWSSRRSRGRRSCLRRKSASMVSLLRWMTGAMMWLGRSPLSCTIYSPRSVSTTSMRRLLEMGVEPDLLRHHRLALGDELGACLLAELEDNGAGVGRIWRVMHLARRSRSLCARKRRDKGRDATAYGP